MNIYDIILTSYQNILKVIQRKITCMKSSACLRVHGTFLGRNIHAFKMDKKIKKNTHVLMEK